MVRGIILFFLASVLTACASTQRSTPENRLGLPSNLIYTEERPEGSVLASFTSALGLPCQRISSSAGKVIACQSTDGWLVVQDLTDSSLQ